MGCADPTPVCDTECGKDIAEIHAADKCNSTVGNTVAGPCGCTWEDKAKELQAHELAFKRLTLIQLDALCIQGGLDQLKPLPLHLGEQLEPLDELDWSEGALVPEPPGCAGSGGGRAKRAAPPAAQRAHYAGNPFAGELPRLRSQLSSQLLIG